MAKVSNPLIGKSSGKVGGVIFQTFKGLNIIREKPLTVANPKTDGQKTTRNALKMAVASYRQASDIVKVGFRQSANPLSPYNAFVSENMTNGAIVGSPTLVAIDTAKLAYSKGTMAGSSVTLDSYNSATGELTLNIPAQPLGVGQRTTDKLAVVVEEEDEELLYYLGLAVASRSQPKAVAIIASKPSSLSTASIKYFWYSVEDNQVSDTQEVA